MITKTSYKENNKPNDVISMDPRAFTKVKKGRLIKLTITGDKKNIIVQDYLNMSINNAKLSIKRYGLTIDTLIYEYNNNIKKNRITSQYPKQGKILETNDKISFVVSLGDPPNYYTVSNLMNIAEKTADARSRLDDADFALESARLAKSQVIQQAGTNMLAQANQNTQH